MELSTPSWQKKTIKCRHFCKFIKKEKPKYHMVISISLIQKNTFVLHLFCAPRLCFVSLRPDRRALLVFFSRPCVWRRSVCCSCAPTLCSRPFLWWMDVFPSKIAFSPSASLREQRGSLWWSWPSTLEPSTVTLQSHFYSTLRVL